MANSWWQKRTEHFPLKEANGSSVPRRLNYGNIVSLYSHHDKYVVAEQDGNANVNLSNISNLGKWMPVNPSNPSSTSRIHYDDKIAFRSYHKTYLVAEADSTVNVNAILAGIVSLVIKS